MPPLHPLPDPNSQCPSSTLQHFSEIWVVKYPTQWQYRDHLVAPLIIMGKGFIWFLLSLYAIVWGSLNILKGFFFSLILTKTYLVIDRVLSLGSEFIFVFVLYWICVFIYFWWDTSLVLGRVLSWVSECQSGWNRKWVPGGTIWGPGMTSDRTAPLDFWYPG